MMTDNAPQQASDHARAGGVDYGELYRDYWSRPDRWGSHSFADADAICDQLLLAFGQGRTLDVGCGMGLLVRTLLRRGIDAHGVDVADAPVAHAGAICPGRFGVGSILALPFADDAFDTVCSTDVLEHIAEADVPRALGELRRVARRGAFVRLAVTPDRDRTWHLTVRDRRWWEQRFYEAGFERHPLAFRAVPYESLDSEGWQVTLVLARATADAGAPTRSATPEDELACALVARCQLLVRPGDRVAFVGDPSLAALLERGSPCASLEVLSAEELAAREPDSLEAIVAAEAVDPLQAARLLVPTGRLMLCGKDALGGVGERAGLDVELVLVREGEHRSLRPLRDGEEHPPALLVLSRSPIGAATPYAERVYPELPNDPSFHVANYARDHDNPWLLRGMISIGLRPAREQLVAEHAEALLDGPSAARAGSADRGAALCVLGYRLLEPQDPDPAAIDRTLGDIDRYDADADDTPHAWRWRVSNRYLAGLLHLARGRLAEAERAFAACMAMDPLRFSPLLASKTIDSAYHAGVLALGRGDRALARERFAAGLESLERACKADWLNVWGERDHPLPFGLPDLNSSVELAARCAFALDQLDAWGTKPGLAWQQASRRTLSDLRRWVQRLSDSRNHLDRERGRLRELALARQDHIDHLKRQMDAQRERIDRAGEAIAERDRALTTLRAHLDDRVAAIDYLRQQLAQRDQRVEELRSHASERSETIARLSEQLAQRDARIEELKKYATERSETIARLSEQLAQRDTRIEELKSYATERSETIARLCEQLTQRDARVEELKSHAAERNETVGRLSEQLTQRDARIAELSAYLTERNGAIEWLREMLAARDARIAELSAYAQSLAAARNGAVDQPSGALEDALREIESLQSRLASLEAEARSARESLEQVREQSRAEVRGELSRLRGDIATLRVWSSDLLATLRAIQRSFAPVAKPAPKPGPHENSGEEGSSR